MTTTIRQPLISTIHDRSLRDDTEESVSGSDFHLAAIVALYEVLLRYARHTARRWYVTAEVLVLVDVPERPRNPWRVMPDVYVVPDADDVQRISLDTRGELPFPPFVCEVASESTWRRDIREKQRIYADLGVREYIVFDPTGALLGEQVRAWHRTPDEQWERWLPDAEGFLSSATLGLRLRAEGTLPRVYDPYAGRLPIGGELADTVTVLEQVARKRGEALDQERARRLALEDEIARLRGERDLHN